MKKKTINAFTLVEMLIVIVIIGILIAALMPRMQAAQGRARDVSRKTALSQIQSAIVTSQGDKGRRPGCSGSICVTTGQNVSDISTLLQAAGMNSVPKDPIQGSKVTGLGDDGSDGEYRYLVTMRNGTPNGGFVLMAKTEVEGGSNWVVCTDAIDLSGGKISSTTDINSIKLCETVSQAGKDSCVGESCGIKQNGVCCYSGEADLRYVVVY